MTPPLTASGLCLTFLSGDDSGVAAFGEAAQSILNMEKNIQAVAQECGDKIKANYGATVFTKLARLIEAALAGHASVKIVYKSSNIFVEISA